jgi:hypothetical protein
MPIINQMGVEAAAQRPLINQALRFQLEHVETECKHYLGVGAEIGSDTAGLMPHEWGSLDSYDDMRNTLAVALELADNLLIVSPEEQREFLRRTIADRGWCVTDPRVLELAWPGQVENGSWLDELDGYRS